MGERNYIDIDWPDLFKPIPGLDREQYNRIRINREVIPIIFVPGIMGSRLRNKKTGESVWDPDRQIMCMLVKYGGFWNTPAQRKEMLIGGVFHPRYLEVDTNSHRHNKKFRHSDDPDRAARGWGGIYWGSYGKFLEQLQNHQWETPVTSSGVQKLKEMVGNCFEFPVYAFGYNWTDSNFNSGEKLAREIEQIIWRYGSKGRKCKYVILVSHSMGGLVCRSACKLHDAESSVLGVIHGAQPATGSPAAYWRMKAGFERTGTGILEQMNSTVSAWVLGTNGEEVTCILGNAPGGLELLPNQHYTDNNGNVGWLRVPLSGSNELVLPMNGDPYEEIYKVKTQKFWRLINPEWLSPRGGGNDQVPTTNVKSTPWQQFIECINKAQTFHLQLNTQIHKHTFEVYSTSVKTVDNIKFNKSTHQATHINKAAAYPDTCVTIAEPKTRPCTRGGMTTYVTEDNDEITPIRDLSKEMFVASMLHPNDYSAGGDGTVPDSSAKALEGTTICHKVERINHQDVFCNMDVTSFVIRSIRKLALMRIHQERSSN